MDVSDKMINNTIEKFNFDGCQCNNQLEAVVLLLHPRPFRAKISRHFSRIPTPACSGRRLQRENKA